MDKDLLNNFVFEIIMQVPINIYNCHLISNTACNLETKNSTKVAVVVKVSF